jgi:hypothetical protein
MSFALTFRDVCVNLRPQFARGGTCQSIAAATPISSMLCKCALKALMVDRRSPAALVVAEHIVTFAEAGERDPARLCGLAVEAIRVKRRKGASRAVNLAPT